MNEQHIRKTFELMKQENELIEVRAINSRSNYSGYFKNVDNLIKELPRFDDCNIYFVMNQISDACYSREQRERFIEKAKNTTSDNDISKREWLLVDVDPKRSAGVSSSDAEKNASKETINKIYSYLSASGFSQPIVCDSGNGYHLLYKISIDNTNDAKELLKSFLLVLDMMFANDVCDIDKTVFNSARITKLYGTGARKGLSTDERPHRESYIVRSPQEIKVTPIELIEKVVDQLPKKQPQQNSYQNRDQFDLDKFISTHGIDVKQVQQFSGGTKYILNQCFFNESHKGKDAAIFKLDNGAISYKCLHNSCSHYTWKDVRLQFEPNAYDRQGNNYAVNRITNSKFEKKEVEKIDSSKKFLSISEVESIDRSQIVSMPSGFSDLDKHIIGFNKGEVTLWSGKNGSAKSTILNQVALNTIESGFNGVIFSGELQAHKLKNWLYLQAAGKQYTKKSDKFEGVYYVQKDVTKKIDEWLDGKLYIYNNDYGNDYIQLLEDLKTFVKEKNLSWAILDNLMAIDLDENNFNSNKQQKVFIKEVSALSKTENIHIHLVAHPRKDVGFLRKESISGSADLSNMAENVIICHRNNSDYQRAIADYFPKELIEGLTQCSNYIEVCKNRDLGIMDFMTGLHYEVESKRLLSEQFENRVYSWQDAPVQSSIVSPSFYEPIKSSESAFMSENEYPF